MKFTKFAVLLFGTLLLMSVLQPPLWFEASRWAIWAGSLAILVSGAQGAGQAVGRHGPGEGLPVPFHFPVAHSSHVSEPRVHKCGHIGNVQGMLLVPFPASLCLAALALFFFLKGLMLLCSLVAFLWY